MHHIKIENTMDGHYFSLLLISCLWIELKVHLRILAIFLLCNYKNYKLICEFNWQMLIIWRHYLSKKRAKIMSEIGKANKNESSHLIIFVQQHESIYIIDKILRLEISFVTDIRDCLHPKMTKHGTTTNRIFFFKKQEDDWGRIIDERFEFMNIKFEGMHCSSF